MKAYRLHEFAGPDAYRLEELASPTPGPGEVLVSIRAVSLNYRDLMISKGVYNPKLRLPLIPLSDGVGEVAVTGAGVTRFKPGERVAASFMPAWVGGQLDDTKARSTLGGDVDGVQLWCIFPCYAEPLRPAATRLIEELKATGACVIDRKSVV